MSRERIESGAIRHEGDAQTQAVRAETLQQPGSREIAPAGDGTEPLGSRSVKGNGDAPLLTDKQSNLLEEIVKRDDTYGRRARALIALHQGKTQAAAGSFSGLAPRTVRYWLARFRREQLGIFPDKVLNDIDAAAEASGSNPKDVSSDTPGIAPEDTMSEAARKTLRFHFERMLSAESGTRAGEDIEALHDMRVATRRMRAALRVFKPYIDWKALKPYRKGIRRTCKALGAVRDLDVYYEKTKRYIDASSEPQGPDLDPLIEAWSDAHSRARDRLIDYLDGDRYCRFTESFHDLLQSPLPAPDPEAKDGTIVPHRVRHVVPAVIYERLAHVRAFDGWILKPGTPLERYHRLRIAAKNLRYALEFFEEVLGTEVDTVVDHLKVVQDHLGDLQDALMAVQTLRNFWMWGQFDAPKKAKANRIDALPVIAPDVARYHADKQAEIQALLDAFPDIWQWFHSDAFSALIARTVRRL